MKWSVTTPPAGPLIEWAKLSAHMNVDDENEKPIIMDYLASAVEHAQRKMAMLLQLQTVTVTHYVGDELCLPRGPLVSIVSMEDAEGADVDHELRQIGNRVYIHPEKTVKLPMVTVYQAGYATVPADIVSAIRVHVATLYRYRETSSDRAVNDVHKLDEFYRFRRTSPPGK